MSSYHSLQRSKWECRYPVDFIPKYRKERIFGQIKQHLGSVFRKLAEERESEINEEHLMSDHVHMLISIPREEARPTLSPLRQTTRGRSEREIWSLLPHPPKRE